ETEVAQAAARATEAAQATAAAQVPPTSPPSSGGCGGMPAASGVVITPLCGPPGTTFTLNGSGFTPGEVVVSHYVDPDGATHSLAKGQSTANETGAVCCPLLTIRTSAGLGVYKIEMQSESGKIATGYFKVLAP
ncbi:MAG: hypothetical protein M3Z04_02150, partial [Chloroflexota bacterium]|nr:hypothetical protein [Chloroflexota bacterium]